jgi:exodeoxyribonuclease VII large subunit
MKALTVTQVNTYIKAILDEAAPLQNLYVCGEISNFTHYYKSGHMYFTIKDENSQLKAVMFCANAEKIKFKPENGMKVVCFGRISAYERDGLYQLYVSDMQPQGVGALAVAFDQLKEKLEKEGLFDKLHKKPIPRYPNRIGVATSNMGAAVEDIKNIISRRYPICELIIVPTVVQGDAATLDIVKSIQFLDAMDGVDTIIVGRGGGSLEDLWAFNTEAVARAVFNCKTPIISAVGHETDYTICDFVADLRAPTPSAAAELAVPDIISERVALDSLSKAMDVSIKQIIDYKEQSLNELTKNTVITNSNLYFDNAKEKLDEYSKDMKLHLTKLVTDKEYALKQIASTLNALSPLDVLGRGYSIVKNNNGIVTKAEDLQVGDDVQIRFKSGSVDATIVEVHANE